MIRTFCRNLLLRCLILALTGNEAAEVIVEDAPDRGRSVAIGDAGARSPGAAGWQQALLPVGAYDMVWDGAF